MFCLHVLKTLLVVSTIPQKTEIPAHSPHPHFWLLPESFRRDMEMCFPTVILQMYFFLKNSKVLQNTVIKS